MIREARAEPWARSRLRSGLRRRFAKDGIERRSKLFRVACREAKRRPKLEDVMMRSVGSGEDPLFAQPVDHVRCLRSRGRAGFAIGDQVNSEKKSKPANIANHVVLFLQGTQIGDPLRANG